MRLASIPYKTMRYILVGWLVSLGVGHGQPGHPHQGQPILIQGRCIFDGQETQLDAPAHRLFIRAEKGDLYSVTLPHARDPKDGTQLGATLQIAGFVNNPPFDVNATNLDNALVLNKRPIATPAIGQIDASWVDKEVSVYTIIREVQNHDNGLLITVEDYDHRGQTIETLWSPTVTQTLRADPREAPNLPWLHAWYTFRAWTPELAPEPGFFVQRIYGTVQMLEGRVVIKALIVS